MWKTIQDNLLLIKNFPKPQSKKNEVKQMFRSFLPTTKKKKKSIF